MSDLTLAEKDPELMLGEALAAYKSLTGVTLAPADPRRLHLQAFVLLLAQQRALIDFSGKQSLLKYVTSLWINDLALLQSEAPLPAQPSRVTLRFVASAPGVLTITAGKRVTDGVNIWAVDETVIAGSASPATEAIATASCTVPGSSSNGVAVGFINVLVDSIVGIASVANTTESADGSNVEDVEAFRARLRTATEDASLAGPRGAYSAVVRKFFPTTLEDVAVLAALDDSTGTGMAGASPAAGEIQIFVMQVGHPSGPTVGFIAAVGTALSPEDVRPLADQVTVKSPVFSDFDAVATYYIARSRIDSVDAIQTAVESAWADYLTWQRKIGRDINPSQMIAGLVGAGAKRVAVTNPSYTVLKRDQCSRVNYVALTYGGVEDD